MTLHRLGRDVQFSGDALVRAAARSVAAPGARGWLVGQARGPRWSGGWQRSIRWRTPRGQSQGVARGRRRRPRALARRRRSGHRLRCSWPRSRGLRGPDRLLSDEHPRQSLFAHQRPRSHPSPDPRCDAGRRHYRRVAPGGARARGVRSSAARVNRRGGGRSGSSRRGRRHGVDDSRSTRCHDDGPLIGLLASSISASRARARRTGGTRAPVVGRGRRRAILDLHG